MAQQALWAQMLKINGKDVPQQVTVVKRHKPNNYHNEPTEAPSGPVSPQPTISNSAGYQSGAGVDGEVQPGKMVESQLHEGEGVISANAMQNLTKDEFNKFLKALESGELKKDHFRMAIGEEAVGGYQQGGIVNAGINRNLSLPSFNSSINPPSTIMDPVVGGNDLEFVPKEDGTNSTRPPNPLAAPLVTRDQPGNDSLNVKIDPQEPISAPTITRETPTVDPLQTRFDPPREDRDGKRVMMPGFNLVAPPEHERDDQGYIIPAKIEPSDTVQPKEPELVKATPEPTVQQTPTSAAAESIARESLQNLRDTMRGMSDADKRIANYYLSNMDATNAASMRRLESQISADPDLSDEGKRAAIAGAIREYNARRDQVSGELAASSANRAYQATQAALSGSQQVRAYEDITRPTAMVNIEQMKNEMGDDVWSTVQDMINRGTDIRRVNSFLSEKGIPGLNSQEYSSMFGATPLGERDYGRMATAANMLLSTPGEGNKEAAAAIYESLLPGVDFDFSQLVTEEQSQMFGDGISQMSTYINADLSFDEALQAMRNDGTFDKMNMSESQASGLYNALNVNYIDAEWDRMEKSEFWNTLSEEERENQREFFRQKMLGNLDYDTLHEYDIYDAKGEFVTTIYGKDSTEADKFAAKHGHTVDDTGNVKFAMASTITEPTDAAAEGTTKSDWEEFKKTIPSAVTSSPNYNEDQLFQQWSDWREGNKDEDNEYDELKPQQSINTADINEVFGNIGDSIIAAGKDGSTNPQYDAVLKARVDAIMNKESPVNASDLDVDGPVFKELLKSVPVGTDTKDFTTNHWQVRNFTHAMDKGIPVRIGDEYYFVDSKEKRITGRDGGTRYQLKKVGGTGEAYFVSVDEHFVTPPMTEREITDWIRDN